MIKIGTFLQDRYLIGKQIGEGGMGAVYSAIDQRFENRVAIKETFYNHDELNEAFEREARLLNSLHHPVLPHVSDFFTEDNKHFLVMEFIEGTDLSEVLNSGGKFSATDVLRWANQLLDALDFLHSQNPPIIHRDIKPQNLKITPRGDIILLDFGLAKLESADQPGVRSVFGYSRTYSPLEQIEGTGTDFRSDIFSLGASGYHLLTGRPPIDALKRAAAIISGKPDPLQPASDYNSEINPAIVHILHTALALNPAERYSSAKAMRTAIKHALNDDLPAFAENSAVNLTAADDKLVIGEPQTDFPALTAFANDPEHNPAAAQNDELFVYASQPVIAETALAVPVSERRALSQSPKNLIAAGFLVLFSIAGLTAWFYAGQNDSPSKPNEVSVVQSATPSSAPPIQKEIPIIQSAADDKVIDTVALSPLKKSATKGLTVEEKISPAIIQSKPPVAASAKSKTFGQPKIARPSEEKSAEQITRPRIVPQSQPVRRESSVAEIRRFLIGAPLSREERRQRRQERRRRVLESRNDRRDDLYFP